MINKKFAVSVFLALLLSGCANEEAALSVQVSKKVDDEKLSLIVLSKSERNSEAEEQKKLNNCESEKKIGFCL